MTHNTTVTEKEPTEEELLIYKTKRIEAAETIRSIWEVPCRSMEQLRLRIESTERFCKSWNLSLGVPFYSNHRFQTLLLLEEI